MKRESSKQLSPHSRSTRTQLVRPDENQPKTLSLSTVTPPPSQLSPGYDYADHLEASLLFYEAQRSGKLPATNRIRFRNDSSLNDKAPDGSDISGGYHDAGDHLKLNFPMAWTFTHLAWGYLDFRKGYDAAGQAAQMRATLKWAADYFMKCHFDELSYVAQVGTESADHGFWGRPEDMKMARPAIAIGPGKPGSDLAGQTAAALAAIAMAFEAVDPEYAMRCEAHARELYTLATRWEGKFSKSLSVRSFLNFEFWEGRERKEKKKKEDEIFIPLLLKEKKPEKKLQVGNMYPSNTHLDDLTMAAGWLARRTGEPAYLADAANYWKRMRSEEAGVSLKKVLKPISPPTCFILLLRRSSRGRRRRKKTHFFPLPQI